jgi:hypothetical protein
MSLETEAPKKPTYSSTRLDTYLTCGEAYRRRYILGEKIPPGVALIRGRSVHKAAEINYRQKLETREDLPVEQIVDSAAAEFEATVEGEGVLFNFEEERIGAGKVIGAAKDDTTSCARVFAERVSPAVQPLIVEEMVRIDLPDRDFDLIGKIDTVDELEYVRDLKTSGRRKAQADVDTSDQLTWYSAAYRKLTGRTPKGVVLDVLLCQKTPSVQRLVSHRTTRDIDVFLARLNAFVAGVSGGIFLPATPGHWKCSPKWCGYWHTCPYVNTERREAAAMARGD